MMHPCDMIFEAVNGDLYAVVKETINGHYYKFTKNNCYKLTWAGGNDYVIKDDNNREMIISPDDNKEFIIRKGNSIQTYTGISFFPLDPRPEEIKIIDIAHALSNICRFTGHCNSFYSVAEHSVLCAREIQEHFRSINSLYGLLHDASEAYICDIASPIKKNKKMGFYRDAEDVLSKMIYNVFNLTEPEPEIVKIVDKRLLVTEQEQLFSNKLKWETNNSLPLDIVIEGWPPKVAQNKFLETFKDLIIK